MPKFSGSPTAVPSAVRATVPTLTHEGGPSYERESKGELFITALTSFIREDTFYESAKTRDNRLVSLAHVVAQKDPGWYAQFVPWLRREGFMRSAPVVLAAEYVAAGGSNGRGVVEAALQRADEPAEMLAYWLSKYGRRIPQPLKRGVADAVRRLYTERAVLKYDGSARAWRFGDVIELVHPKPKADWQSDLFRFCLDRRRHKVDIPESLSMIRQIMDLEAIPHDERRLSAVAAEGMTWERLSGWLPGGMTAEAWEHVIPQMGYMALVRNLRNFNDAGLDDTVKATVAEELARPEAVARSMQFPFRFYSAWKQAIGLEWGPALEKALDLSTSNIPTFTGRTLVIVDVSGSMMSTYSARGTMTPLEAAMVFGGSLYAKNREDTDLIGAATDSVPIPWQGSVLRTSEFVKTHTVGSATYLGRAVSQWYREHDRIILFTDGQFHDKLPSVECPVYFFNLNGYGNIPAPVGRGQFHELGGLSDATFKLIPMLESQKAGTWPWE